MDEEKKTKILVVDDEQDIVEVLSYLLTKAGYAVVPATNGRAAVEAVASDGVGLVILDYMLPDINGLEVLRRIKELRPDIRVIIITGRATDRLLAEAVEAGAYGYVIKPFVNEHLMELIRKALTT